MKIVSTGCCCYKMLVLDLLLFLDMSAANEGTQVSAQACCASVSALAFDGPRPFMSL